MEEKKNVFEIAKDKTVKFIDENGNGEIDLEDIIVKALRTPGIRVNRADYIKSAFKKYCEEDTIKKAIEERPAKAGISRKIVDRAANESISKETTLATASSVGLASIPGGVAVDVATTVTDIGQFYGHLLIVMQKLMYLYGYPELDLSKDDSGIDDGTMNLIIIGIGTMAGVEAAGKFMNKMAVMLANNVPKILLKGVLAEKAAYQVAKQVLKYFGIRLTRDLATKGLGNGIKFIGGAIVGGITLATFSSSCKNFKKKISDSPLSDPHYIDQSNIIEAQFSTVEEVEKEFEKDIVIDEEDDDKEKEE